jgi:putative aldouronate transport system permease protein
MLTMELKLKELSINSAQSALSAQRLITGESLKMATIVVTTLPIVCVYPFIQKYFVKGTMIGAIKG